MVDQAADAWVKESQQRAPVDTGRLRASIGRKGPGGGKSATVGADAPYASFVDQGTRHMAAQPFWLPGRRAALDVIRRAKLRP